MNEDAEAVLNSTATSAWYMEDITHNEASFARRILQCWLAHTTFRRCSSSRPALSAKMIGSGCRIPFRTQQVRVSNSADSSEILLPGEM